MPHHFIGDGGSWVAHFRFGPHSRLRMRGRFSRTARGDHPSDGPRSLFPKPGSAVRQETRPAYHENGNRSTVPHRSFICNGGSGSDGWIRCRVLPALLKIVLEDMPPRRDLPKQAIIGWDRTTAGSRVPQKESMLTDSERSAPPERRVEQSSVQSWLSIPSGRRSSTPR